MSFTRHLKHPSHPSYQIHANTTNALPMLAHGARYYSNSTLLKTCRMTFIMEWIFLSAFIAEINNVAQNFHDTYSH